MVSEEWRRYVEQRKEAELATIIEEENLRPDETRTFVDAAFHDGAIQESGTAITRILPPVSRFSRDQRRGAKKERVLKRLGEFVERFFSLIAKRE